MVVITDYQVVQGNPVATEQLVRYQVELKSGEFQWFNEHELREPVRQSSSPKLNRQWVLTSICSGSRCRGGGTRVNVTPKPFQR